MKRCVHCNTNEQHQNPYKLCKECYFTKDIVKVYRASAAARKTDVVTVADDHDQRTADEMICPPLSAADFVGPGGNLLRRERDLEAIRKYKEAIALDYVVPFKPTIVSQDDPNFCAQMRCHLVANKAARERYPARKPDVNEISKNLADFKAMFIRYMELLGIEVPPPLPSQ